MTLGCLHVEPRSNPRSEGGLCSASPWLSRVSKEKASVLRSVAVVSNSFGTTWTVAHQAPLSMGFSRQEYWSKLPFLLPGHHPHPRLLHLLHWQLDFLPLYHWGSSKRKFTLRNTDRSRQTARVFLIKYIDKLHAEWRDMFTHTHTHTHTYTHTKQTSSENSPNKEKRAIP